MVVGCTTAETCLSAAHGLLLEQVFMASERFVDRLCAAVCEHESRNWRWNCNVVVVDHRLLIRVNGAWVYCLILG